MRIACFGIQVSRILDMASILMVFRGSNKTVPNSFGIFRSSVLVYNCIEAENTFRQTAAQLAMSSLRNIILALSHSLTMLIENCHVVYSVTSTIPHRAEITYRKPPLPSVRYLG